jgi:hypothetical protein
MKPALSDNTEAYGYSKPNDIGRCDDHADDTSDCCGISELCDDFDYCSIKVKLEIVWGVAIILVQLGTSSKYVTLLSSWR